MDTVETGLLGEPSRFRLFTERQERLRATMRQVDCEVLLILDSVNILYATGASNMTLFTTRTPCRRRLLAELPAAT